MNRSSRLMAALALALLMGPMGRAQGAFERAPAGQSLTETGEALAAEESLLLQRRGDPSALRRPASPLASPATAAEPGQIQIISPEGYQYWDEETNLVYGRERTTVIYEDMKITADRLVVDLLLQEIQCEGDVVVEREGQTIRCEALRYNFRDNSGAAYNASGQLGPLFFRPTRGRTDSSFEILNKDESLFRHYEFTTCDFPEPMYAIRAKEVIAFFDDRVLLRSATLEIRGVPVMYFPFFSRSLRGGIPWYFRIGHSSQSGAYARLGYIYTHQREVPSWEDDSVSVSKSRGEADVYVDYLSKRGPGAGFDYRYEFDYSRHRGRLQAYASSDPGRLSAEDDSAQRWQLLARHRSQLHRDIYLQGVVDEVSDPEVYYDILDRFEQIERGRVPERDSRLAVTLNKERMLARVQVGVKHRVGRDRFTDFSDPQDDDRDFDVEPGILDKRDEGIPSDRWGLVGMRAPEINVATNELRLGQSNMYYRGQLNLFNSLDRGMNIVSRDDDAWVHGLDLYQSLTHVHRFNDRVTWLNRVGVGVGAAMRGDPDEPLVDGSRGFAPAGTLTSPPVFPMGDPFEGQFVGFYDGLFFTDPSTFHIGRSGELASYDDVSDTFVYGDIESRLSARFSNALQGFVRYTNRMTTENHLGDFYARMGDQMIRSDLYDFPLRSHWIDANLTYSLFQPAITLFAATGRNLTPLGDLWPNEEIWFYTIGGSHVTDSGRIRTSSSVSFRENQFFHPDDPRSQQTTQFQWQGSTMYVDPSEQWWARFAADWRTNFRGGGLDDDDETSLFREDEQRLRLRPGFGVRVGPKWTVVTDAIYDSRISALDRLSFSLNRDLHDALLAIRLRLNREVFSRQEDDKDKQGGFLNNMDISFTVSPKLPNQQAPIGIPHRRTLDQQFRRTALELEG